MSKIEHYDHWIGGKETKPSSNKYFDVLNPLDDSLLYKAAHGSAEDIDSAVQSAHECFQTFGKTLANEREALLCRAADILERDADDFVRILVDEVGSPISKAKFEVSLSLDMLRAAAGMARQVSGKTMPSDVPGRLSYSLRSPLGVVASITPFNVPLIKGIRLSANPLAVGNTVVMLPSEETPTITARLGQLYKDAGFPDGAFNYVSGFGFEIGDSLTTHPLVKVVTFTGSTVVGNHIRGLCGEHGKRVVLELGGKSPLVVLKDADLEKAVMGAARSIFTFQGQICMGASRIIVEQDIYEEFMTKFKAAAEGMAQNGMGDLRDASTILGPIISDRQRKRIKSHIDDAVSKGANLITGGVWAGHRVSPTILEGVGEEMMVCREETFGPVTSVYSVENLEEALEKANDTVYGLSASIYTTNLNSAMQYALEIESGMVHINAPTMHDEPHVPFGGTGESGFGREGTEDDLETMTELKWVTVQL